jgi:hypothetical protein
VRAQWNSRNEKIEAVEKVAPVMPAEDMELARRLWTARKDNFFEGITFRFVRTKEGES